MADVLVCIKRVPGAAGQVDLTEDGLSIDARHVGYSLSPHEECAIELAVQVAAASGGKVTVLSLGPAEAGEQLRDAIAIGADHGVLIEADGERFGPADVAAAIADLVRADEADGTAYDLILVGNEAADTADFQVGIRLAHELERPVVTGIKTLAVQDTTVVARGKSPDGTVVYELPLPAVVTVSEGGVAPRYPSVIGRMKARKAVLRSVEPARWPAGSGRLGLSVPPEQPSHVEVLGTGPEAAGALVDLFERLGVLGR